VVCGAPGVKAVVLPPASQGGWMVADRGGTLWYCQAHLRQAKSMQRTYGFSMRGAWVLLGLIVVVVLIALAVNSLSGG
jgi:hypothetical protein